MTSNRGDDLTQLLRRWAYEPGRMNARIITGQDGASKIQIRVELGILQMEMSGRPDGAQPMGFDSSLVYHTYRLQEHIEKTGSDKDFAIDREACRTLREEAVQYYHRFIALFALEQYTAVIRDTTHTVHLIDLCRQYGQSAEDRDALEQYRPAVLAMRVRGEVALAMASGSRGDAMHLIDQGLEQLRAAFEEAGRAEEFDNANETHMLRGLRDALVPKLPASQRVELEERLRAAVADENYELAAILREELRLL